MNKRAKLSTIPSLRHENGTWGLEAKPKADLFASTWTAKNRLPPSLNMDPFFDPPVQRQCETIILRTRDVRNILSTVDVLKATGPYPVGSNRILKELASELAIPIVCLCRRTLKEGKWPEKWKVHNMNPIYKRNSVYMAKNYRGIHITFFFVYVTSARLSSYHLPTLH